MKHELSAMLESQLRAIEQEHCDEIGRRIASICEALAEATKRSADDGPPVPYDVSVNFTKFFAILDAIAGGDLSGKTVLDVGCGGGGFMSVALGLRMDPTGIDIYSGQAHAHPAAERMLRSAGVPERLLAAKLRHADITHPLGDLTGAFDFATSSGMLEHIPQKAARVAAVSNMVRALKSTGSLVLLCAPNVRLPIDLCHLGPKYPFYHVLPYSMKRVYMRKVIQPRRPDLNDVQRSPEFLTGTSVKEIEQAIRAVDPDAAISQAFPLMTRLAVSRDWLRKPVAHRVIRALSLTLVRLKMEPIILIVATRSG